MRHRLQVHKATANVGPLDFSHLLEAPAGRRGFVQSRDGHLKFSDGTRARFIGFNLPARSNTPDHESAVRLAARLASLGVNVVRLHAADAPIGHEPGSWSSAADSPLLDYAGGTTRSFHPDGLDRFDFFVAELRSRGIYLHIDLLVARAFLEGDDLDYPGSLPGSLKCYPMVNRRLIELQQEYARALLTHVNPYTGLALVDDPAVMTVQINNEDSVIKGTAEHVGDERVRPYRDELQGRFGHFLLQKYGSRSGLARAWTHDDVCALGDDEDPAKGTVRIVEGDFIQPVNDPMGAWDGDVSPARYADWMDFGIDANRRYYREMRRFLRSIGVRVPIATSNLLGGAADVYGHIDGDVMENNSYFNHPLLPYQDNTYVVGGLQDYVAMNPLTMQTESPLRTSLLSLASTAVVAGKPFVMSEWNEYGAAPFHATAAVHTVAYACLNDWDGLILYCHHTSERWDDQPADEILNLFDAYNDVALISQWVFMATMFLKGLVTPAPHRADLVITRDDLLTLPPAHAMPTTVLPYLLSLRTVFVDDGDSYAGDADVAVSAGFVNGGDLSGARHSVTYAWSPYLDAHRRSRDDDRLARLADGGEELSKGVTLSDRALVFGNIRELAGDRDYRAFAGPLDAALKRWGVLPEGTGLVDGRFVSQTGELEFDPDRARFSIRTPSCAYVSGALRAVEHLGEQVRVECTNERMSVALLPLDHSSLAAARSFLLTAVGETGMDETTFTPVDVYPGVPFTAVALGGKVFADVLEGAVEVVTTGRDLDAPVLEALDMHGHPIGRITPERTESGFRFLLTGEHPATNFHLHLG